jgi:hypothetical protein
VPGDQRLVCGSTDGLILSRSRDPVHVGIGKHLRAATLGSYLKMGLCSIIGFTHSDDRIGRRFAGLVMWCDMNVCKHSKGIERWCVA